MATLSAKLHVGEQVFEVLDCTTQQHQATDWRGQGHPRVQQDRVTLVLNVPRGTFFVGWAATPFKRLEANITFEDIDGGGVAYSLYLPAAYCVNYEEHFVAGEAGHGSFQCRIILAAPDGWQMRPGAPAAYVAPAAREHGPPPMASSIVPSAPAASGASTCPPGRNRKVANAGGANV